MAGIETVFGGALKVGCVGRVQEILYGKVLKAEL
jgi:hypothetical protein